MWCVRASRRSVRYANHRLFLTSRRDLHSVGQSGKVIGVEHIPELVAFSEDNLRRDGLVRALEKGEIEVRVADGRLGR